MKIHKYEVSIGSMDSWMYGPFLGLSIDDTKSRQGWIFNINWLFLVPLFICGFIILYYFFGR